MDVSPQRRSSDLQYNTTEQLCAKFNILFDI